MKKFTVDLSVTPLSPRGFKMLENITGGVVELDSSMVTLWVTEKQKDNHCVRASELDEELADKPIAGAALADFWFANPKFIPWRFNSKYLVFRGTVFESASGKKCYRCLYRAHGVWISDYLWCDRLFRPDELAVGLAEDVAA